MAGNTQIDPRTEGGLFSFLHGVTGMLVATSILLTSLVVLTYLAIDTQQSNATNFYTINQDLNGLKKNSPENYKMRTNVKGE